jgi:hypothetical protein
MSEPKQVSMLPYYVATDARLRCHACPQRYTAQSRRRLDAVRIRLAKIRATFVPPPSSVLRTATGTGHSSKASVAALSGWYRSLDNRRLNPSALPALKIGIDNTRTRYAIQVRRRSSEGRSVELADVG